MNILVVDDREENRYLLEQLLRGNGHQVQTAADGLEALEKLAAAPFDLVITDVMMPRMDGFELCYNAKNDPRLKHLRIVIYTATYTGSEDRRFALSLGADAFILKPEEPAAFVKNLHEIVQRAANVPATHAPRLTLDQVEFLRAYNARLVKKLFQRAEELRSAIRAKNDFIALLSHELRTPLNPVLLIASDAAADESLPEEVRSRFRSIVKYVELESRLIDDLLDVNKIALGKLAIERSPLDVHEVLRETADMLEAEAQARDVRLTLSLHAHTPTVAGDPLRLRQVFTNLAKNAVKFTQAGGRIEISTTDAGPAIEIHIRDTGIGMNASDLRQAFDAFFQATSSETRENAQGGLGLGLSITRGLVALHGGTIRLASEGSGRGTLVVVTLPRHEGSAKPADAPDELPANSADAASKPPASVLLVEDHEGTRQAMSTMLARRGYRVTAAANLAEARRHDAWPAFDILLSDIGLPDGDGCSLMMEARKTNPQIFGVAISGYGMDADLARYRAAGFDAHFTKPVNISAVVRTLAGRDAALANSRA